MDSARTFSDLETMYQSNKYASENQNNIFLGNKYE